MKRERLEYILPPKGSRKISNLHVFARGGGGRGKEKKTAVPVHKISIAEADGYVTTELTYWQKG